MVTQITNQAQEAGYQVEGVEQMRANRWLVSLKDQAGMISIILVQQRARVTSADVQDLAELVHLRRAASGVLLAVDGTFTAAARSTAQELNRGQLRLCTEFSASIPVPAATPALEGI